MATNPYFSQAVRSEQGLYEDIVIESLKMYGQNIYYLPRDIVNENKVFAEDVPSTFNSSYVIEMYIENIEGFDGEGDLFTRFGVEIRDQATFIVSRRRWSQTVGRPDNDITEDRPREGDLIYLPMTNKIFQIMHVEHEQPFYQLSNLPVYKLQCELFEYNDEQFDTGVQNIDRVENTGYTLSLTLADSDGSYIVGETVTQTLASGVTVNGEVVYYNDSDNIVKLAHIGSDDGNYHTFANGRITGSDSLVSRVVISQTDEYSQRTAQNETFQASNLSFLDFSEDNPFGEPS